MNFLKKKKVIIPIIIIMWLILIAYVTKFAGALTILGTIAGGIYLFTKNEKFKSKSKKVKAIAVVGLVLIFILGVSAVTYDPVLFQQRKIQAEKVKVEKQKQEQIEKQKEAEEKAKKEAEEKAKETATKTTPKTTTKTTNTKPATQSKAKTTPKTAPKEKSLAKLVAESLDHGKIIPKANELTIQFSGGNLSENMLVEGGLMETIECFKKVYKTDEFKQYNVIHVNVMCELTDQYGKTLSVPGMILTFDQSELQKVQNFDNISIDQLVILQGQYTTGLNSAIRKELSQKNLQMLYPNN
ncbi:hypothetical protein [Clostridium kluyveri]|uniref:Uncharacterized protein n=1 Tax=Clostridium kluyveri TaxID=1534 RepID=A0A1L5F8T2_CLOKL|nr:hypothetical protein [Clostridium kluyveri]APM39392.1 hypothetical protein BS101_11890 [Clostridium kluyveri]